MKNSFNYFDLKMSLDGSGIVTIYKTFVVSAEFFSGPHGEWFESRVFAPVDDLEEFDLVDARLEERTCWENCRFDTEGEALMGAFQCIDAGQCGAGFWD